MGFIGTALPVCIYCIYKDAFSEMLYAAFAFNYLYGTHSAGRIRYDVISILFMTTPFAVCWWDNYGYRAAKEVSDILDQIPVNAHNSIYNYNTRPYWLRASGLQPYNKYCQTQESFIAIDPHIKEEIDVMFLQNPPQYVVIEKYEEIYNTKMQMRLDEEYYMKYQNKVYTLYERSKR